MEQFLISTSSKTAAAAARQRDVQFTSDKAGYRCKKVFQAHATQE